MNSDCSTTPSTEKAARDTIPFEIRGFSLPLVIFTVGILVTASSFVGYIGGGDGAVSSIGFVYGIPIFLIGLSLWYGEIPPVEVITSTAGDRAWEKYATENLKKVKQDVTRHIYGDNAHLDTTLDTLGLRLPQKKYPKLLSLTQEEAPNGQLVFTMTFQSIETPYKTWAEPDRIKRYSKFFGPNVKAEVVKVNSEERLVAIKLTTCTAEEFQQFLDQPLETPSPPTSATPPAVTETLEAMRNQI
eukprot:CAMPEP_0173154094 /NCGR_PEP_ID=MMETSP1105-20130129/13274_1 /TAXON_ID=2985 /ORGANISM="Ochromonas sp., Strain BG-1" /LENGTH=243 /DNA_ID=CAMNT_0014070201 /DNA_START=265 /DNA_END=996 /DNA_ORIENTATION=-